MAVADIHEVNTSTHASLGQATGAILVPGAAAGLGIAGPVTQTDDDACAERPRRASANALVVPVDIGPLAEMADAVKAGGHEARPLRPSARPLARIALRLSAIARHAAGLGRFRPRARPSPSARPIAVVGPAVAGAPSGAREGRAPTGRLRLRWPVAVAVAVTCPTAFSLSLADGRPPRRKNARPAGPLPLTDTASARRSDEGLPPVAEIATRPRRPSEGTTAPTSPAPAIDAAALPRLTAIVPRVARPPACEAAEADKRRPDVRFGPLSPTLRGRPRLRPEAQRPRAGLLARQTPLSVASDGLTSVGRTPRMTRQAEVSVAARRPLSPPRALPAV